MPDNNDNSSSSPYQSVLDNYSSKTSDLTPPSPKPSVPITSPDVKNSISPPKTSPIIKTSPSPPKIAPLSSLPPTKPSKPLLPPLPPTPKTSSLPPLPPIAKLPPAPITPSDTKLPNEDKSTLPPKPAETVPSLPIISSPLPKPPSPPKSPPFIKPSKPLLPPLTAKPSTPASSLDKKTSPSPSPMIKPPPLSKKPIQAVSPKPTKNKPDIFKYIFFLSLLIFLVVAGCVVLTVINSQQVGPTPLPSLPVSTPTPVTLSSQVCRLNDQEYQVDQSFPAADNCNTCTCQSDLIITCTDKKCD